MLSILVVDDRVDYREALVRLLDKQPDMEVVAQAGSLSEARENKLEGIDVALLDRGLPDGDGLELIGDVRRASPGVKVLMMSLTMEQMHPGEALEAGADGIVDKVALPQEISDRAREAVLE